MAFPHRNRNIISHFSSKSLAFPLRFHSFQYPSSRRSFTMKQAHTRHSDCVWELSFSRLPSRIHFQREEHSLLLNRNSAKVFYLRVKTFSVELFKSDENNWVGAKKNTRKVSLMINPKHDTRALAILSVVCHFPLGLLIVWCSRFARSSPAIYYNIFKSNIDAEKSTIRAE